MWSTVISSLGPCVSVAARLVLQHTLFNKCLRVLEEYRGFASLSSFEITQIP